jgi:hypothetical protein
VAYILLRYLAADFSPDITPGTTVPLTPLSPPGLLRAIWQASIQIAVDVMSTGLDEYAKLSGSPCNAAIIPFR